MKLLRMICPTLLGLILIFGSTAAMASECPSTLKFIKRKLNSSETVNLCEAYQGQVVLVVNTASYCGFTKQFKGLESLYEKYKDKGLVVLGFPSHDFNQEDQDEGKAAELCELTYGVKFPMFEPVSVRGSDADPLYRILAKQGDKTPKWNFYKYLLDRQGRVVGAFNSMTKPESDTLIKAIENVL